MGLASHNVIRQQAARLTARKRKRRFVPAMKRKMVVTLLEHEDGISVSCPELPGCHSQGATVAEALENIQDAIQGYLELYGQPDVRCEVREMEVTTG